MKLASALALLLVLPCVWMQTTSPPSFRAGPGGTPRPTRAGPVITPQPTRAGPVSTPRPTSSGAGTPRPTSSGAGTPRPTSSGAGTPRPTSSGAATPRPTSSGAATPQPTPNRPTFRPTMLFTRRPSRYPTKFPIRSPTGYPTPPPVSSCKLPPIGSLGQGIAPASATCKQYMLKQGERCDVRCLPGFTSNGGSTFFSCLAGALVKPTVRCSPRMCVLPSQLGPNVKFAPGQRTGCATGNSMTDGDMCLVACDTGYKPIKGSSAFLCKGGKMAYNATLECASRNPTASSPTARIPTVPTASSPTARTPTASSPTASSPTASSPTARTPTASSPTASAADPCKLPVELFAPLNPGVEGAFGVYTGTSMLPPCMPGYMRPGTSCAVRCRKGYVPVNKRLSAVSSCSSMGGPKGLKAAQLRCTNCNTTASVSAAVVPANRTVDPTKINAIMLRTKVTTCRETNRTVEWVQVSGPQVRIPYPRRSVLYFPPKVLRPGMTYCFEAKLTVAGVQKFDGPWTGMAKTRACLTPADKKPRAVIDGGDRLVSAADEVEVDGSKSEDPLAGVPGASSTPITYKWNCTVRSSGASCFAGGSSPSLTGSKLRIPRNSLSADTKYDIYLTVKTASGKVSVTKKEYTTAKTTVAQAGLIKVRARVASEFRLLSSGDMLVDRGSKLRVNATIKGVTRAQLARYVFNWTVVGANGEVLGDSEMKSKKGSPSLVIAKGALDAGIRYVASLQVRDPSSGSIGRTRVAVVSKKGPEGGSCTAVPSNVTFDNAKNVKFQCSGWAGTGGEVKYRFAMVRYNPIRRKYVNLIEFGAGYSPDAELSVRRLPPGKAANGYRLKIRAFIKDSGAIESISKEDFEVVVRPPSRAKVEADGGASELAENLVDEDLEPMAEEDDEGGIAQVVSSISEVLSSDSEVSDARSTNVTKKQAFLAKAKAVRKRVMEKIKASVESEVTSTESAERRVRMLASLVDEPDQVDDDLEKDVLEAMEKVINNSTDKASTELAQATVKACGKLIKRRQASSSTATANRTKAKALAERVKKTIRKVTANAQKNRVADENPVELQTDEMTVTSAKLSREAVSSQAETTVRPSNTTFKTEAKVPKSVFDAITSTDTVIVDVIEYKENPQKDAPSNVQSRTTPRAASRAVSVSIQDEEGSEISVQNAADDIKVVVEKEPSVTKTASETSRCQYYDEGTEKWETTGVSVDSEDSEKFTCKTNHLTLFSAVFTESIEQTNTAAGGDENTGAMAGIIGGVLGGVAVLVIAAFVFHKKNKNQFSVAQDDSVNDDSMNEAL